MKKLKDILLEGYAWERTPGKPLPTLAEVQAEYQRNESANDAKAKIAKLEKKIADVKHQYYSDKNLTDEKSQKLRKQLGELGRELKRAKREDKTGSAGYDKSSKSDAKPDFLDLDKDGNTEEPMKDAADDMNEEFEMMDEADMDVLNMTDIEEYGDDETHSIDADSPKNSESDVRETDMNESFWNRVKGNLHGHEYILREAFRK